MHLQLVVRTDLHNSYNNLSLVNGAFGALILQHLLNTVNDVMHLKANYALLKLGSAEGYNPLQAVKIQCLLKFLGVDKQ